MIRDDRHFSRGYPLGFLVRAAALSALACSLGLWLLRWFFSRDLGSEFAPAFYLLRHLVGFLVPALAFCLLAVLLVAFCALFSVALFASHKIAGPLFRLQRVSSYLNRKILIGRIHLRAGDQGFPLAAAINEWVQVRKDRLRRSRDFAESVDEFLCARENSPGECNGETLRKAAAALVARLDERESTNP